MKIDDHLLIVSGPSGAGKTTLVRNLMEGFPELVESVSHTTRDPRPGEEDGVDYHFVSSEEFDQIEFVESADVHGCRYGTARETLERLAGAGKSIAAVVDYQGVESLLEAFPDATVVLVLVPNLETLRSRLDARGDDREAVTRRIDIARHEMSRLILRADHLVMNSTLAYANIMMRSIYTGLHQRWG